MLVVIPVSHKRLIKCPQITEFQNRIYSLPSLLASNRKQYNVNAGTHHTHTHTHTLILYVPWGLYLIELCERVLCRWVMGGLQLPVCQEIHSE